MKLGATTAQLLTSELDIFILHRLVRDLSSINAISIAAKWVRIELSNRLNKSRPCVWRFPAGRKSKAIKGGIRA
jgi:hypothetical protein